MEEGRNGRAVVPEGEGEREIEGEREEGWSRRTLAVSQISVAV